MAVTSAAIGFALRVIGGAALRSLISASDDPRRAQAAALQRILRRNADTAFGEAHHFDRLDDSGAYTRRVEVQDYEGFRPYLHRILNGDDRVLTAQPPVMLAKTSGTTGEPKLIPVTKGSLVVESRLTRAWMASAARAHPGILDHRALGIVSPAVDQVTAHGLPIGNTSGMIYRSTPALLRRRYAVPEAVFSVADYDTRYFLVTRFALARRLSVIATPNPATLLRLTDVLYSHADQLIAAIRDGTMGTELDVPAGIQADLSARLRRQPDRAAELEALAESVGRLEPAHVWPDLQLVGCWLGGTSGLQADRLIERFGSAPFRDLGYLATEGHFTVPLGDSSPGGLLDLNTNYYEFVPEGEAPADGVTFGAHELEIKQRYAVVLTTTAGLYRYDINDIVEVTDRYRAAPVLAFVRKSGEMTNLAGEKLHANHVIAALASMRTLGAPVRSAQLAADIEHMRYQLRLELEPGTEADAETLARQFEEAMIRTNIEYAEKRRSRRLAPIEARIMPDGWSENIRRKGPSEGGSDAQYKWAYLIGPESPAT